jgi:hypothetical protein
MPRFAIGAVLAARRVADAARLQVSSKKNLSFAEKTVCPSSPKTNRGAGSTLAAARRGPTMPRRWFRACFGLMWSLSYVLAQQDEPSVYIRAEGTEKAKGQKVLGIGVGVFLIAFFFIVALILCASGLLMPAERNEGWCAACLSQMRGPRKGDVALVRIATPSWRRIFNLVGTLLFFLVSAILLLAEPEPRYSSTENTVSVRDPGKRPHATSTRNLD